MLIFMLKHLTFLHDDRRLVTNLNNIQIPEISGQTKEHCDMTINVEENKKAINDLANNRCPGPNGFPCEFIRRLRGHGGRVVTLSRPTSESGVRFRAQPQVGKLVVPCRWLAVYSTEP